MFVYSGDSEFSLPLYWVFFFFLFTLPRSLIESPITVIKTNYIKQTLQEECHTRVSVCVCELQFREYKAFNWQEMHVWFKIIQWNSSSLVFLHYQSTTVFNNNFWKWRMKVANCQLLWMYNDSFHKQIPGTYF